jgi:hypothetical protein
VDDAPRVALDEAHVECVMCESIVLKSEAVLVDPDALLEDPEGATYFCDECARILSRFL